MRIQANLQFNALPKVGDDVYLGLNGKARTTSPYDGAERIGKVVQVVGEDDVLVDMDKSAYEAYKGSKNEQTAKLARIDEALNTIDAIDENDPETQRKFAELLSNAMDCGNAYNLIENIRSRFDLGFGNLVDENEAKEIAKEVVLINAPNEDEIQTIARRVSRAEVGVVLEGWRAEFTEKVDQIGDQTQDFASSLATRLVSQASLIDILAKRVLALEEEAKETVIIEPAPLAEVLRLADDRIAKLTEAEAYLDSLAWKVFDNHGYLKLAGGYYDLANLAEDIVKLNKIKGHDELVMTLEDSTATALRWCRSRTRWLRNARFWVQPASGTLVIKRNRFIFQVKNPPSDAMELDL